MDGEGVSDDPDYLGLREWDDSDRLLHLMWFQVQRTSTVLRGEVEGAWGFELRAFGDAMQGTAPGGARPSKLEAGRTNKQGQGRDAFDLAAELVPRKL